MRVMVNGEARDLAPGTTVRQLAGDGRGLAVAVNGEVLRSAEWRSTTLSEDDRVEVVTAHQGG